MSVIITINISGTELISVIQSAMVFIWLKNKAKACPDVETTAQPATSQPTQRGQRKKK